MRTQFKVLNCCAYAAVINLDEMPAKGEFSLEGCVSSAFEGTNYYHSVLATLSSTQNQAATRKALMDAGFVVIHTIKRNHKTGNTVELLVLDREVWLAKKKEAKEAAAAAKKAARQYEDRAAAPVPTPAPTPPRRRVAEEVAPAQGIVQRRRAVPNVRARVR